MALVTEKCQTQYKSKIRNKMPRTTQNKRHGSTGAWWPGVQEREAHSTSFGAEAFNNIQRESRRKWLLGFPGSSDKSVD